MADLATLQANLVDAEAAYHRLLTGSREEQVRYGEKEVRFTRTMADELARYINQLKSEIAMLGGGGLPRRALTVNL